MGCLDGSHLLLAPHRPEHDGTVGTSGGEELLVNRVPAEGQGLPLVTPERLEVLLQVADVENLKQVVTGSRQQPIPIFVPPVKTGLTL